MTLTLTTDDEALTPEVKWLNQMFGTSPETAVIQVTTLLGAIMLRRTDGTQWRQVMVPANGAVQGTVCVDADNLDRALKTLKGTITVTLDDERLVLADGERTVKLRAATTLEYPAWPTFEPSDDERTAVGAVQFGRVLTSVGHDETMPQLSVVAFDKGAMVTTDRHRLTKVECGKKGFVGQVPVEAMKAFAKANGVVWVQSGTVTDNDGLWVQLTSGNRSVTTLTADTTFPRWRQLIPTDAPISVVLSRDELFKAVGGDEMELTIVAPQGDTTDGQLRVTTIADGMEVEQRLWLEGVQRFDADSPLTVKLRSRYVKEALRAIGSGLVLLTATASNKPVMFQDIAKNDLHLIMPVRSAS